MAKGDHIVVERPHGWLVAGMTHHGIDLGDGTVVHFTGRNTSDAIVMRSNIRVFAQNGEPQVVDYDAIRRDPPWFIAGEDMRNKTVIIECLPPDEVVRSALDMVEQFEGDYNPIARNCEHLATLLKTGASFSLAVEDRYRRTVLEDPVGGIPALITTVLWEVRRFLRHPRKLGDGRYLAGIMYTNGNKFYLEGYQNPEQIAPFWWESTSEKGPWGPVYPRDVPYPLNEFALSYIAETGGQEEVYIREGDNFRKLE